MDVQMIAMDREEASERLVAYRLYLEGRHSQEIAEEYRAAVAGYEALAAGTPLINLRDVIVAGGFDEQSRPRLAVGRPDRKQVRFTWRGNTEGASFDCRANPTIWGSTETTLVTQVDMGRRHGLTRVVSWQTYPIEQMVEGWALIPMVPPEALKAVGGASRLKDHLILWEVEEWADRPIQVMPDRDPFLLRRIAGDLYAVMAQWDLTELERQVMTGRRDA